MIEIESITVVILTALALLSFVTFQENHRGRPRLKPLSKIVLPQRSQSMLDEPTVEEFVGELVQKLDIGNAPLMPLPTNKVILPEFSEDATVGSVVKELVQRLEIETPLLQRAPLPESIGIPPKIGQKVFYPTYDRAGNPRFVPCKVVGRTPTGYHLRPVWCPPGSCQNVERGRLAVFHPRERRKHL